jgi:hypothetical protein
MDKIKLVQRLYVYFLNKFSGARYSISFNERNLKVVDSFFKLLQKKHNLDQLDVNWFFNYFLITFSFYFNKDLKGGNKIYLNWIFSKKSYEKYININREQLYYAQQFKIIKNIRLSDFIKSYKIDNIGLTEREEIERKRFLNTKEGLFNCIESTTLYHNKSLTCISCNNKVECKQTLKETYPNFYKERIICED